jgi:hypothetical protein
VIWRVFVRQLVFSALWVFALLIFTQLRLLWLCVFAGGVLGFLTDCALDIVAVRRHQRGLARQSRRRFEASETVATPPRSEDRPARNAAHSVAGGESRIANSGGALP